MSQVIHSNDNNILPNSKPLAGFEQIKRYYHKERECHIAKILPGEFYVCEQREIISTVLGSCIAACIRDKKSAIAGMNHFMLPSQNANEEQQPHSIIDESTRYGNWAMEYLINEILKNGGKRENLEVKIFGGGNVLKGMNNINIGERNIEFVRNYLKQEGLRIVGEDVGDIYPRKVLFYTDTGEVKMKKVHQEYLTTVERREISYVQRIEQKPQSGSVESF